MNEKFKIQNFLKNKKTNRYKDEQHITKIWKEYFKCNKILKKIKNKSQHNFFYFCPFYLYPQRLALPLPLALPLEDKSKRKSKKNKGNKNQFSNLYNLLKKKNYILKAIFELKKNSINSSSIDKIKLDTDESAESGFSSEEPSRGPTEERGE